MSKAELVAHLLEHSVKTGSFTLKSGKQSSWFIDAKQTLCRGEGILLVAEEMLAVLPAGVRARVDRGAWEVPQVQALLIERGGIAAPEAERVFNLGIGMVVVVRPGDAGAAVIAFGDAGVDARVIGEVTGA